MVDFRVTSPSPTPALFEALVNGARRFVADDQAGITAYVLVFFILMLVAGGMAVDWQRYELVRADLQDALDRGTLAATNRNQTYAVDGLLSEDEQAEQLIAQYMESRNYHSGAVSLSVAVDPISGGRSVTASAVDRLETIFLRLVGINSMDVAATSGAIYAYPKLEIVLVLDISKSMDFNSTSAPGTKLDQLKVAAKEFIDTVLGDNNHSPTLVTVVPFSEQVNLPRSLADNYNLNRHHDYASCFDPRDLDFGSTAMPTNPATPYRQYQHFIETVGGGSTYGCPQINNAITPFSHDRTALKNAIDALTVESYTASYMGMKWGAALLDPTARPVISNMRTNGQLADDYAGWPNAWNDPSTRKIFVLMSDGKNTKLNKIVDGIYSQHTPAYWNSTPPTNGQKLAYVDNEKTGEGDRMLKSICDQIKAGPSATIFTIGFELAGEPVATAALKDCASSLSTFYEVDGVEISTAFQNIADEIITLKLMN